MNEAYSEPTVNCPIGLFAGVEREIADITTAINGAPSVKEKAPLAGELRAAVSVLLDCTAYDGDNINCRICRQFSELRNNTAALVEQAAGLVR